MARYKVTWEIDIEAGTPGQAARQALAIQRDPESIATVFEVMAVPPCPACRAHVVHKIGCRIFKATGRHNIDYPVSVDVRQLGPGGAR